MVRLFKKDKYIQGGMILMSDYEYQIASGKPWKNRPDSGESGETYD